MMAKFCSKGALAPSPALEELAVLAENRRRWMLKRAVCLQAQLGPSPVSPLGVVPDLVASFHPYPLWDRSVLLLLFGEKAFNPEGLMRRHF